MKLLPSLMLLIFAGCLFVLPACDPDPVELVPVAKFTTPIIEYGTVTFRNYSINATEYHWDFGDGNTSTEKAPVYDYTSIGNYTVVLTASDGVNTDQASAIVPVSKIFPPNLIELDPFSGGARSETLFFTWNGKAYVGLGLQSFQHTYDLWEFDPATDTWTAKNSSPREFSRGASFVIDGIAYFGLGQPIWGTDGASFYTYDIQNDTYELETTFPVNNSNDLRRDPVSFSFGGKGYVIGGDELSLKSVWEYDPGPKIWTQKTSYPGDGNSGMYAFQEDGKVYIGMGNQYYYSSYDNESDFWEYDIANDSWTQLNDFPGKDRRDGIAFSYNGKGYLGFGWSSDINTGFPETFSDIWEYNIGSDEWNLIENFPLHSAHHLYGFVLGDSFYFGGGVNIGNASLGDFYKYEF